MKLKRFITNKYTLSVIILICCLIADIILHKGMSRVIVPEEFTEKRQPQYLAVCSQILIQKSKHWIHGVNTREKMNKLSTGTAGFEMDVYYDISENKLEVYHDSGNIAHLDVDSVLTLYKQKNLDASIWFDFKNLTLANEGPALKKFIDIRNRYDLDKKMVIESTVPKSLRTFCDSGFFTSYYIPYFNPYLLSETELVDQIDSISYQMKLYPASALSGYYFQYPVLKKFFPGFPVLTWTYNSNISLVTNMFNLHLKNDDQVKIVLYPL